MREILSHEQVQARTHQRRLHVFKIVVLASMVAPLAGELTSYLAGQSYSAVLPSSLMISLSGVITYLWYYRSGKLDTAIIINAIIQIGCFSWGALVAGGTRSEQFFYLSLFPVLNGFFLGRRAALITTIYTVLFAITLGALEHKGLIAVHQPPILAITFQTVACLFIIGWLTMTYEGERSRNEKELTQLVEVKGSLNRYYDNTLEGAGLGTWDWMLDTNAVHFDRRWCEMIGIDYRSVEHQIETWESRVHPDDKAKCYADIRAHLEGKTPYYENIHRLKHANGTWVWILDRGRISARDPSGKPIRFTGTHFDITRFKEAERLSSELQKVANIGAWELNSKTNLITWTDQTFKMHALAPQESLDLNLVQSFFKAEDRVRLVHAMQNALNGSSFRDTFEMTDARGVHKWVDVLGVPYADFDGKILGLRGTIQDVTEKKSAENQLRKSEIEVREIMSAIEQSAIVTTTDKFGKILTVNPEFCRVTGYRADELISHDYLMIIADQESESLHQQAWSAVKSGQTWSGELRFRTKSGRSLIVRSVVGPVHNQEGQIDRAISIHFDISEQMRLQSQLEQAQRLAKIGNWSYQLMSKQIEWSKQMYELFAVSIQNGPPTLEQHLLNIHPEDRAQWHKTVQKTMATGEKYVLRYRSVLPDRILWIEAIGQGLYDRDGKLMALAGTCQDITEKVHNENLLEQQRLKTIHAAKLASLGEMSAGVAHEVNNPLAIIKGTLPLLAECRGNQQDFTLKLEMLERAVLRISKIVNGLRRFSRAAEGNILTPNRLSEIVADANIITDLKAKRFDVSVENQIESDALILCDPIEIEQVIINLINNGIDAAKESDKRWVKVHLFESGDYVFLHVIDSGRGISAEVENKLFQPFFTTKPIGEGTGLGLSICKGILEQHNAAINLNRNYNSTCFEVRFHRHVV